MDNVERILSGESVREILSKAKSVRRGLTAEKLSSVYNLRLYEDELDVLKAAISYLRSNKDDVEDALDITISEGDVESVEKKVHSAKSTTLSESRVGRLSVEGDGEQDQEVSRDPETVIYNPDELAAGIKVEKEHLGTMIAIRENPGLSNIQISELIAKDHLREIPDYYTRLKKMENEYSKQISTTGK